ncbi:MAG: branched-chain amino acid ABC transporter permease [Clostridiales bacterium]|nr:branched-chain amino acid ABC transporter permease [Clostridiales bacterium]
MSVLKNQSAVGKKWRNLVMGTILAVVVYAVMKVLILVDVIDPFLVKIVYKICIDVILALGLNLITGITGQFSLGHAGFMAVGAYTAAMLVTQTGDSFGSLLLICLAATVMGGLAGFLIGVPTLRLKGDYLAIATLGFAEIIRIVLLNVDQSVFGGAAGLSGLPLFTNFEWVFISVVLVFVLVRNFVKSSYGRACISVREDEVAAEAMGINLTRTKLMAFVVGTALAGFAGALYMGNVGYLAPKDFGFMKSIDILMIVVIGGLGNIWGTFGAAILMNIVSMLLQDFSEIRMIVYALVLIIIMLVKSGESPVFVKLRAFFSKNLNVRALRQRLSRKARNAK